MTIRIDLFSCGGEPNCSLSIAAQSNLEIHRRSTPLAQWTESEYSKTIANSNADWLLFADEKLDFIADDLQRFKSECEAQLDASSVVVPAPRFRDLIRSWERLPLPLALLLAPPESFAAIGLRNSAATADCGFRDVDLPLWDRLIRSSSDPNSLAAATATDASPNGTSDLSMPLPSLRPVRPHNARSWLYEHLSRLEIAQLTTAAGNREDIVALKSGLLQIHDYLNESHDLSQTVQGEGRHQAGDYWHAIMHRREPDYSNAKYWFRRVGRHPIYDALSDRATHILTHNASPAASEWKQRLRATNGWEPFEFVDLCEECANGSDEALTQAAEAIQFAEMLLLIEQTYFDIQA